MNKVQAVAGVVVLGLLLQYLWRRGAPSVDDILQNIGAPDELKEHTYQFTTKQVLKVADGVYVAVNYGVANSIMLVGSGGNVIVDTTESIHSAEQIAAEFKAISDVETKAIIYTHHHSDHVIGTRAFIDENQETPDIWAHKLFLKEEHRVHLAGQGQFQRAMSQFGIHLGDSRIQNTGIGGPMLYNLTQKMRIAPNKFVGDEDTELTLAGINMRIIHIPGETADQIGVWLPDTRVLLCADDLYRAFPNLYAIRGVTPRDVMDWANSLDKMRQLGAVCLVGSHSAPICGEQEVYDLISNYMYGIQYVHDQTVRYINKGWHPDKIAKTVKLPPELATHTHLMQYYGTVHWSVKAVYIMYMGWFSGEAVDLDPLTPSERAERMVKLVGKTGLLKAAASAIKVRDYQWALELATHVHRLEPDNAWAKQIRRDAMARLAEQQMSAPGRNFYMSEMIKDEGLFPKIDLKNIAAKLPVELIIQLMKPRLKAEVIPPGERITGCFHFTDTDKTICLVLQKSVLNISYELLPDHDFILKTTENIWKEVVTAERSPLGSYLTGSIKVEGSILTLRRFMTYFDRG